MAVAVAAPIAIAATSPLLAWRQPVYIAAGFAGVVALALLLIQPLLAAGALPGLTMRRSRRVHAWIGVALVLAIILHVGGLWVTSPPDVIDALLFRSPTPFSVWGVIAMWAAFAAAGLAALRARLRLRPKIWRLSHSALVALVVVGTVVHALLIEGTMGTASKVALCALALAATLKALIDLRAWALLRRRRSA
ncbi:MAG: ferric reductase-like transmembrane domain-containing protein [Pseudomonadota bacterium]